MRNSYVLFFFALFLSGSTVFAQGNNRIFFGGAAANTKNLNYSTTVNTANGSENITVQSMNVIIGMLLLGQRMVPNPLNPSSTENNEQVDLGFLGTSVIFMTLLPIMPSRFRKGIILTKYNSTGNSSTTLKM